MTWIRVADRFKKFLPLESECWLPCSQKHLTCPRCEPNESFHALQSYFFKIYCNIILPSTPRYSKFSLSLSFADQSPTPICILPHPCHMHRPCYSPLFGYPRHLNYFFLNFFWPIISFPFLLLGWHMAFVRKWEIHMRNFHRKVSCDLISQMSYEGMNWLRIVYTRRIIWRRYWKLVFYNGRRNSGLRNFLCLSKNCVTELNGLWFH